MRLSYKPSNKAKHSLPNLQLQLEIPTMNDDAPLGSLYIPNIPRQLNKLGHTHRNSCWLVPEGVDWRDALSPHYWALCLKEMDAGDRRGRGSSACILAGPKGRSPP